MGLFEIKASAFEIGEEAFHPPSFFGGIEGVVARCVAPQDAPFVRQS